MTLTEHISNFLRDAQYKIAVLSVEIDTLEDDGSYQYQKALMSRRQLITFIDILFEGMWPIADEEFNHLQSADWTDREIIQEIEYQRYYHNMNEMPMINFTAHYPKITECIGGETSGSAFPSGLEGQFLLYNASNLPYADYIDPWAGHQGESATSYFLGRT